MNLEIYIFNKSEPASYDQCTARMVSCYVPIDRGTPCVYITFPMPLFLPLDPYLERVGGVGSFLKHLASLAPGPVPGTYAFLFYFFLFGSTRD
jgi:hypothetical protein